MRRRRRAASAALHAEVDALRARLDEAEQTLDAIRVGQVDALVVYGDGGEQIYTLKGADHSYRRLVETMSEGAVTVSTGGTILYCNSRFAEMLQVPLELVIGREIHRFLPEDAHFWFDALLRPEGQTRTAKSELEMLTGKGGRVPVHLSVTAAGKEEGGGVCVVATDLTGSLLLSRERAARAEAERVNRAKDEFLTTLSHELRTPLTAILGWTQLLMSMEELDGDMIGRGLETIERNVRAQGRIIEDLLDVSSIITGKLRLSVRTIDLGPVVEAAIDVVRPAAQAKGIRLEGRLEPCTINGDPDRLQQVFWNLLVNAVKFTPASGRIDVRLGASQGHAELRVTDSGIGISSEFLPNVFDRFTQADGSSTRLFGGLGIGLAIARHLVELHGGSVRAESAGKDLGTTFIVRIPTAEVHREASDGKALVRLQAADGARLLAGLKVLVVEDDSDAREFLQFALRRWGAAVVLAASTDEALEAMDRAVPDVLVSDIAMPGSDGYALIRAVRARGRGQGGGVPAVALTAYASAEDRMRILGAGFEMHVPKPIEPAELALVIQRLAGRTGQEQPSLSE
jgi:PAS domain S-box-containing protein